MARVDGSPISDAIERLGCPRLAGSHGRVHRVKLSCAELLNNLRGKLGRWPHAGLRGSSARRGLTSLLLSSQSTPMTMRNGNTYLLAVILSLCGFTSAQNFTVLHRFTGGPG